jgi:hypothetical protein
LPAGIFKWYFTRIRVTRITPSIASMSPSTALHSFSGWVAIPRASSAPARVPVSQPPTAAIR